MDAMRSTAITAHAIHLILPGFKDSAVVIPRKTSMPGIRKGMSPVEYVVMQNRLMKAIRRTAPDMFRTRSFFHPEAAAGSSTLRTGSAERTPATKVSPSLMKESYEGVSGVTAPKTIS